MDVGTAETTSESRFAALRRRFARRHARVVGPADETGHIEMTLSEMAPGEYGHVLSICECCEARQHLLVERLLLRRLRHRDDRSGR